MNRVIRAYSQSNPYRTLYLFLTIKVKDAQKPSAELLGCMCTIVLGFSSFFAVCGYDGMCRATTSGNDPGVPGHHYSNNGMNFRYLAWLLVDLKYCFVRGFVSSFPSDFALPCLVIMLCAGPTLVLLPKS